MNDIGRMAERASEEEEIAGKITVILGGNP
jgi:hypothetical protein